MVFHRRHLIRIAPALGALSLPLSGAATQQADAEAWPGKPPETGSPPDESFPSQHAFLVREIVGVSHGNLGRVKELVSQRPALAKASWDWGFGDWETALGAASHVGNRAIAEFLIENGAPPTIFSATMLGQLDVVEAFAQTTPDIHLLRGPHGIPITAHARAGGEAAARVLAFLKSLGESLPPLERQPLTDKARTAIEGRYVFGSRPRDSFLVDSEKNQLGIRRAGASRRNLFHLGNLEFHPAGAPAVRIRFEHRQTGVTLSLFDPDLVARAEKS